VVKEDKQGLIEEQRSLLDRVTELEHEVSVNNKQITIKEADLKNFKRVLQELKERTEISEDKLGQQIENLKETNDSLESKVDELQSTNAKLNQEREISEDKLGQQIENLKETIESLESKVDELQSANAKLNQERIASKNDFDE
jgi:chromosome segregation ATPase